MTTAIRPVIYEVRWISGRKEGIRFVRAISENDAISELQDNASFYGCPTNRPLIVWAIPTERIAETLNA